MMRILLFSLFIIALCGCNSNEVESALVVDFKLSPEYQEALQALQSVSAFDNGAFLTEKLGKANRLYGGELVAQTINKSDSLLNVRGPEGLSENDFSDVQKKIVSDLYRESDEKKDAYMKFAEAIRRVTASYPEVTPMELMQSLKADMVDIE
jgi:hypothetical protein